ncbi:hypothetical protein LUZ63_018704 [Rhynchospora breviuscula]|uniref:NB-ARC domain-containing protein n=1 Tax=Rhynchospora breviuscula TaxID=2022672 RepID=A0A9Q0HIE0_9POAL|nr:hypothetical protein LUZ63_018704 [Rhynchospora breviuscula]
MVETMTTSAVSWGLSAAGWLLSPILTKFVNKCYDALGIDPPPHLLCRKQALLDKLENLQTFLLPQLLILTEAVQQSPHRPLLKQLLQKLRYAFYEAEHVLGLIEYNRLEKEVSSIFPSISKSKCSFKKLKSKLKCESTKKDLIKSLENLEKTVNEAMKIVGLLNQPNSSVHNSTDRPNELIKETISNPGTEVIGREEDRKYIVELLQENIPESSSNAKCYSVIAIWGMGGSGKTTLAQYVCEYVKEANYFDLVIWTHVSKKFSVRAIWERIWESAFKESCPNFSSPEGLQSKLEEKLRGQKFLLVLDDAWCDERISVQEVEKLFAPLSASKRGSKVLVTTRMEETAKILGAMNPIPLRELDEVQFLSLLMCNALGDEKIGDMEEKLTSIGKKIAAKLCRSPLAAKTVARQLHRRLDPDFWSSMLNRSGLLNDTMGALYLSYQYLPPALQRCFAFCSLFPKGHYFDHDHLVNLWIAEGFTEADENINKHPKQIANWYILELISSSFFQVDKLNSNSYYMHDLMHELAEHVSEGECFRIESGDEKKIPTETRHIFVVLDMLEEYMDKICNLNYLCTIIVRTSLSNFCLKKVELDALFMKCRKLHVVDIQCYVVERVPKSVMHLRNLRYLNLVTKLLDETHISLNKLYRLCVIYTGRQISNVGSLISLHNLKEFRIGAASGFELKQLEHLMNLFGSLSIYGLHNVKNAEEAYRTNLAGKKDLHTLLFSWDYESKYVLREIDVEILEGLSPPPQIKKLAIKGYSGKRFPSWILENNDNIKYLKHLELADCVGMEALARINELYDLQYLSISFLPRLNSWEPLPMKVTQLELSHCLSLAFVCDRDLEVITSIRSSIISQIVTFMENSLRKNVHGSIDFQFECVLEMMKLGNHIDEETLSTISKDLKKCLEKRLDLIFQLTNKYSELFLSPALNKLSIRSCFITDRILAQSLQGLTSLTQLTLVDIITITCISKEVLRSLNNLMVLDVTGCMLLTLIEGWDTHKTLEELTIECCPSLILETSAAAKSRSILKKVILGACMPSDDMLQGLASLEGLWIWDCPTIENLGIYHLKSLIDLVVRHCPNLVSLRGISGLKNLKFLDVVGCKNFKCYSDADKVPQLNQLYISRLSLLEELISLNGFSYLVSLNLYEGQQSKEECEVLHHLSSIEEIIFSQCKLRSLPPLQCLRSLKSVTIDRCVNLISLPDLPPSVQTIFIRYCNEEFTKSCKDTSHQNWHKISHIPEKNIRP